MAPILSTAELTHKIDLAARSFDAGCRDASDKERKELAAACERLRSTVEDPADAVRRAMYAMLQPMAMRVAMGMGMFDKAAIYKGQPLSLEHLTALGQSDPLLATRIMRLLVATNVFDETEDGKYLATPVAGLLASDSPFSAGLERYFDIFLPTFGKLPEYLRNNGFKNPENATAAPFQFAFGTQLHHFDWLQENPQQLLAFNRLMTRQRQGEDWFNFYPVEARLAHHGQAGPEDTLLVDIGGGFGHDLVKFHQRFPDVQGKLVLQDQHSTIKAIKDLPPAISTMTHDFFTTNPICGARAYYMRSVLHDWPDAEAREILDNIRQAMTDQSVLLLSEYVMPERGAPLPAIQMDLCMMAMYAAMERTESQWETLLRSAGFSIIRIWRPDMVEPESASLIEARPILW